MPLDYTKVPKRILIIEDEKVAAQLYKGLIEDALAPQTISIHHAVNGELGFEQMRRETFDLIICDINMPQKNGIEALEETALQGMNIGTPILVITGFVEDSVPLAKKNLFKNITFLEKPVKPKEIKSTIKDVLAKDGS